MTSKKKKGYVFCLLLAVVLQFSVCARPVQAEENVQSQDGGEPAEGLCAHHPAHDEGCGYVEGNPDMPCTYVCSQCMEEAEDQPDTEETDSVEPLADIEKTADSTDKSDGFLFHQSGYGPSLPDTETVYTAGGGQIVWTPNLDENGAVVSGRLTLKDAVIHNSNTVPDENYGSGIWMPVPFELVLEGDNRITAAGSGILLPDAAHSGTYDLNISGSGSLTIDSRQFGILTDGTVTLDGAELTVTYGFASGILTEYGNIVIQNGSHVRVKSSDDASVSGVAVGTNNSGDVIIKDSHVTVINRVGSAVHALGEARFENSEVTAMGTGSVAGAGNGKVFTVSGGSLYIKNTGSGPYDYDIYPDPNSVKFENSAVIYCGGPYNYLIQQGDNIQYANCVYDESTDQVTTVGDGNVYGNVNWNSYIRFPLGQNERLYVGMGGSTLTIPEGVTAEIPDGATLRNSYSGADAGALINHGTLNVLDGGTLYNFDAANGDHGVVMKNYGVINLSPQAVFFNSTRLENSGTIYTEGNLCNIQVNYNGDRYNGVIQNTGAIHGLVNVRADGQVVYRAEGTTVLGNGQTLTLGAGTANGGQWGTALEIPAGGSLTVQEGAVVDAKTNVTADTLSDYLKAGDSLVVDGILLLPEDASAEDLEKLAEFITGKGTVKTGDTVNYLVTFDTGDGSVRRQLLADGSRITLPADPVRAGYVFEGWYVNTGGSESAADPSMTVSGNLTIYAKWKAVDTGGDDGPGEDQPGEGDRPGGEEPGGEDTPGSDQPGGDDTGNEENPGGDRPDQDHNSGGSGSSSGSSGSGSSGSGSGDNGTPVSSQNAAASAVTGDPSDPGVWVLGLACSLVFLTGILRRFCREGL